MKFTDSDDAALVRAVQSGDSGAFGPLVDRHLPAVHAFIALKLPMAHLVDELAHETFVFAYRNIEKFKADTSLRGWLRAIAANKVRAEVERYFREQKNQSNYAEHRLIEAASSRDDDEAEREALAMQECLKSLPEHARELIELRYNRGRSAEAMAQHFTRSVPWIRTTLFRIREQLRACIESRLRGNSV